MKLGPLSLESSDLIAAVAALISLLVWWQNRAMVATNKSMAETNKTMAETNNRMAISAEVSAKAAQDAAQMQQRAEQIASKACLFLARDKGFRGYEILPTEKSVQDEAGNSHRTGLFKLYLRNEGQFPARNCQLSLKTFDTPNRLKIEGGKPKRLGPGEIGEFSFLVPYLPLEELDYDIDFTAKVDFEDGLGKDVIMFGLSFFLPEVPKESSMVPWRVKLMPEIDYRSRLCRPPGESDDDDWD